MNFEYRDAIVKGNSLMIKKVIDELRPKFYGVLKKYGANNLECKEYFQISLLAMSENFILDMNKQVPDNKIFNYFMTIGLNKWRTYCKQKDREIHRENLSEISFETTILEDLIRKEEHSAFMHKYRKLSKDCQYLLWRKIVEEINYREIATELGKSEQYLRVHLNRCKKYLIKLLSSDNSPLHN